MSNRITIHDKDDIINIINNCRIVLIYSDNTNLAEQIKSIDNDYDIYDCIVRCNTARHYVMCKIDSLCKMFHYARADNRKYIITIGGGRLPAEFKHFVDLFVYDCGSGVYRYTKM